MFLLESDDQDLEFRNQCVHKIINEFSILNRYGLTLEKFDLNNYKILDISAEFNLKIYFGRVVFDPIEFLFGQFRFIQFKEKINEVENQESHFDKYFNLDRNKGLEGLLENLKFEFKFDTKTFHKFIIEIETFYDFYVALGELIVKFYFDKYSQFPFRHVSKDSIKTISDSLKFNYDTISDPNLIKQLVSKNPKIFHLEDYLQIDSLEKLYILNSLTQDTSYKNLRTLNCAYHKDYNYVEIDDMSFIPYHLSPFFNIPLSFIDNLLDLSFDLTIGKIIIDLSKFDFKINQKYNIPENVDFYLIIYFDYRDFKSEDYSCSSARKFFLYQTNSISNDIILGKLNIFPLGFQFGYFDDSNGEYNKEVNDPEYLEYKNTITNLDESKINMKSFANFHYPKYKIENVSCTYTPKINSNFTSSPISNELSIPVLIVNQFSENVNVLKKWLESDNLDDYAEYLNEEKSTLTNRELRDLNNQAYEQFDDEI